MRWQSDRKAAAPARVRDGDAAESLRRGLVVLRLAGPFGVADVGGRTRGQGWLEWLGGGEARRELAAFAEVYEAAWRGEFRHLEARGGVVSGLACGMGAVSAEALRRWLLSTNHPRPLRRWCGSVAGRQAGEADLVAVAMAAFHFPPVTAISVWLFLRWRGGWSGDRLATVSRFLDLCGPLLPGLARRAWLERAASQERVAAGHELGK